MSMRCSMTDLISAGSTGRPVTQINISEVNLQVCRARLVKKNMWRVTCDRSYDVSAKRLAVHRIYSYTLQHSRLGSGRSTIVERPDKGNIKEYNVGRSITVHLCALTPIVSVINIITAEDRTHSQLDKDVNIHVDISLLKLTHTSGQSYLSLAGEGVFGDLSCANVNFSQPWEDVHFLQVCSTSAAVSVFVGCRFCCYHVRTSFVNNYVSWKSLI